ncbi:MAG: D-alanyl-D-alanine carboxypeptidase family protein [Rhizomicrobium sp.]
MAFALLALAALLAIGPLEARARHHRWAGHPARAPATLTDPAKDAALVVDGATGKILYARNATAERHPASLTKMMTLYLLFEALRKGEVMMNTNLPVSAHAAAQKPTKLNLRPGDMIPVNSAIEAIVVRSANDVAVTVAEGLGGTESHFAEMMTAKARQLGMRNTFYHNASGLPDPLQISTAEDLAVLAHHLAYDFPQYFHYFGIPGFSYRGITYPTHDNLIGRYQGADGIKTGYTGASGFNLVSSVVRGRNHIIAVVDGWRDCASPRPGNDKPARCDLCADTGEPGDGREHQGAVAGGGYTDRACGTRSFSDLAASRRQSRGRGRGRSSFRYG